MTRVRQEAACWFARMHGAASDDPERGRFEAWLMTDSAHAAEYRAFVALWERLDSVEGCNAVADAMERRQSRRRFVKKGLIGLLFAGAGVQALHHFRQYEPLSQIAMETRAGQVTSKMLDDGSIVTLSARSAITVRFSRGERRIELRDGEAIFDVATDADRPFVVEAGPLRAVALGTRFAISRLSEAIRIAVDHGAVRVETGPFWNRRILTLETSQTAKLILAGDDAGTLRAISRKTADFFAFERNLIVLEMASLAEVAEVLSRYRREPVVAASGSSGSISGPPESDRRITAVVKTDDVDRFLEILPRISEVEVLWSEEKVILRPVQK